MEKLLIIDDFEPVRKTIKRIADREKYQTLQAVDGRDGLSVFEKEKPEIVITDLKMPFIDGKGVLCAIKEHSPETEVIVLTGYGDAETAQFLLNKGAFSYLQKPLDLEQLIGVLNQARQKIRSKRNPTVEQKPSGRLHLEIKGLKEIALQWGAAEALQSSSALQSFANEFPFPLMLIGEGRHILHVNRRGQSFGVRQGIPFNEATLETFVQKGYRLPPGNEFVRVLNTFLMEQEPTVDTQTPELYDAIGFLKVHLSGQEADAQRTVLLVIFPGA